MTLSDHTTGHHMERQANCGFTKHIASCLPAAAVGQPVRAGLRKRGQAQPVLDRGVKLTQRHFPNPTRGVQD
ncbi:hypothetical protein PGT21_036285 [Puccinia graminis f. sp. tritici]|uniref:Uncharacterized protein n=1 Tax=Puccinia graminis f. sp. tritici TaxID=56615 RepID=A0A5B0PHS0_PUCGR|nr:hypothetical protein PGT21_036285 [Puccinia graminis f. sp. tritici]KAA1100372.1 hypothetical protein PGTUg99_024079 [Puccinia graminis f. sp. tritici]